MEIKELSSAKCFGGVLKRFSHQSAVNKCEMKFHVYLPPKAEKEKVPVVWFLSGLTCTDENFVIKSGAFRDASALGIAIISPDTSPRGCNVEGESKDWDFGVGAGFYVNATESKWSNWQMYSYITQELWTIVNSNFPVNDKHSISGHSMGGHGALICSLKNPGKYKSVSAFAPISNPTECPWGQKAFSGYLGQDKEQWKQYDASLLVKDYKGPELHVLIDQGTEDKFYKEKQLLPENFKAEADKNGVAVELNLQDGYDHSYFFVSTFLPQHLQHHAKYLNA